MNKASQKENAVGGVGSSQVFASGFAKFIGDGGLKGDTATGASERVDPHQLPLAFKENHSSSISSAIG